MKMPVRGKCERGVGSTDDDRPKKRARNNPSSPKPKKAAPKTGNDPPKPKRVRKSRSKKTMKRLRTSIVY